MTTNYTAPSGKHTKEICANIVARWRAGKARNNDMPIAGVLSPVATHEKEQATSAFSDNGRKTDGNPPHGSLSEPLYPITGNKLALGDGIVHVGGRTTKSVNERMRAILEGK